MSSTLIADDDTLENQVTTLYFDIDVTLGGDWNLTNKLFYETYENLNENAYGFSQFHDTWVIEEQLILSKVFEGDSLTTSVQISPPSERPTSNMVMITSMSTSRDVT